MVHRYPSVVKAFYMKRDPQNPDLALAVDVLAPEGYGEIIGGSQREDDLDALLKRLRGASASRRKPSNGTSTSGGTAACRMRGSAWGSSGPSPGSAGWTTSARPSRSRG